MHQRHVVSPGTLAFGDDMPPLGERTRVDHIDGRPLGIDLHPRLEAPGTKRGIIAPDRDGDQLPAEGTIHDVRRDLTAAQRARGEVPERTLTPAGLVDRPHGLATTGAGHPHGRVGGIPQAPLDIDLGRGEDELEVVDGLGHTRRR